MSKEVKPLHALFIISFFGMVIFWYVWASGEAVKIIGPDALYKNQHNHLFVRIGHQLLQFDHNGVLRKDINLLQLGAEVSMGDIVFTENNEILFRVGVDSRSFLQNLRAFLRLSNTGSLQAKNSDSGLYKCNLDSYMCTRFTRQSVDYNSVFHLQKDEHDGGVFLADTDRHRIVKYDVQGNEKFVYEQGLKFPNQMKYMNNKLYVANTNRKKVTVLEVKQDALVHIKDIDVLPDLAKLNREVFPVFINKVGDHWWVINKRASMSNGSVYRFDQNWRFINRIELPENSDPDFMLSINDEVLVSDADNFRVYRFKESGKRLDDYTPEKLVAVINHQKQKHEYYVQLSYSPIIIFIIALGIGLIIAIRTELKDKTESNQQIKESVNKYDKTAELVWFSVNNSLFRKLYYISAAVIILLIVVVTMFYSVFESVEQSTDILFPLICIFGFLLFFPIILIVYLKHITKAKIGVQGSYIHLIDHRGESTMGPISDVYYDNRAIVLNNVAVLTGQRIQPFYEKDKMLEYFYPLLEKGNKLNGIKMMVMLYKARHPSIYFEAAIVAMCIGVFLYL